MTTRNTNITRVALDADRTISSESIFVGCILVSNITQAAASVEFLDSDDVVLFNIIVPSGSSYSLDAGFIADNGLKISSIGSADVTVSVFHSHGGA